VAITIRVLRVYHAGRDRGHRARERALTAAGADVTLVVPREWRDSGAEARLSSESFVLAELAVRRSGDVQRHVYTDAAAPRRLIDALRPDVLDIHEEPFSLATRQWLRAAPARLPVVMYAAQNLDKRLPPPFCGYEREAFDRVAAFYPCTRQAASVLRGKGFSRAIDVLPLGYDDAVFSFGSQSLAARELVLMLVGRLIAEKGVEDAVRTLAHVHALRPARLVIFGEGPAERRARELAVSLGVSERVEFRGWQGAFELASAYRTAHVLLVPSRPSTVAEQFGRVIVEAQASGAVVAGYDCGAIAEVAGEAGVVVSVGDVAALAERVARVVDDPADFARRREDGRHQAAARTWQAVAARQLDLYRDVQGAAGSPALALPRSPRQRRALARSEFGPTAVTPAGERPFALPLLQRGGRGAAALGVVIDAAAEAHAVVAR
jgi:glycosyltransferase involved in cell wall biosynthesis